MIRIVHYILADQNNKPAHQHTGYPPTPNPQKITHTSFLHFLTYKGISPSPHIWTLQGVLNTCIPDELGVLFLDVLSQCVHVGFHCICVSRFTATIISNTLPCTYKPPYTLLTTSTRKARRYPQKIQIIPAEKSLVVRYGCYYSACQDYDLVRSEISD